MIDLRRLQEYDPSVKNEEWIRKTVAQLEQSWGPIVDKDEAQKNMELLLGVQSMKHVKEMFTDWKKTNLDFFPMAILEKIRNILTAEILEGGIQVQVKAEDTSSINEKDRDQALLSNRKIIEAIISKEQQSIGGPSYSIADDRDEGGNPIYAGNVAEFDEMGFDEDSSEDTAYFFRFWHRLTHEVAAELAVNSYFKLNEVSARLDDLVDDILAKKAVAYRTYVSETSGQIVHDYLRPEDVRAIPGRRKDFKDSDCLGYYQEVSVQEFLAMVGSDFDPTYDMQHVLNAVNYATGPGGIPYDYIFDMDETGCERGVCGEMGNGKRGVAISQVLTTKISVGYMEFKSNNAAAYKVTKRTNYHGNYSVRRLKSVNDAVNEQNSGYTKVAYFTQDTYKAYFVKTSSAVGRVFKAGRLTWQQVEGSEDEYSSYTTTVVMNSGKTFVEIVRPLVRTIEKAYAKMEYEIQRAKPSGKSYSIESLLKIADHMAPPTTNGGDQRKGRWDALQRVLDFLRASPDELHTYPTVEGNPMGGGPAGASYPLENGLSKTVGDFMRIMDWADAQINNWIGLSPQRTVYQPKPREVANNQNASTQFSMRATYYIPKMIDTCLQGMGVRTIKIVQDIVAYGKGTLAHKHLLSMLGDQTMLDLESLKKTSLHRYGIFVEWYNKEGAREEIKALTYDALNRQEITTEQAILINGVRSPMKAAQVLAYEKGRNQRRRMKDLQDARAHEEKMKQMDQQFELQKVELAGKYRIQAENTDGAWFFEANKARNEMQSQLQTQKAADAAEQVRRQADATTQTIQAQSDATAQQPLDIPSV